VTEQKRLWVLTGIRAAVVDGISIWTFRDFSAEWRLRKWQSILEKGANLRNSLLVTCAV
jgi:hypothetical protein